MCHFLSGVIGKIGSEIEGQLFFGCLDSHYGIEGGYKKLKPGNYREFEWTDEDENSLDVRVEDGEDKSAYKAFIVADLPVLAGQTINSRQDLIKTIKTGCVDGDRYYYKNGKLHRDGDKPAVIWADGTKFYYKNGKLHRGGDKPAVIYTNGTKYYKNGELHRDGDKPAVICASGTKYYYKNGKQHRDGDKPAAICANGTKYYYKNGKQYYI